MTITLAVTNGEDWKELPLQTLLYEWIIKNMTIPTDMSTIVAYLGLFLITWYAIIWITRFVMTIMWPLFLIASAIVVFRILQFYEPDEIKYIAQKTYTIVADTLMPVAVRLVEVLALITLLGILTGFSIFVVAAQRIIFILLLIVTPLTYVIYGILHVSEKIMISALANLLSVTSSVGDF